MPASLPAVPYELVSGIQAGPEADPLHVLAVQDSPDGTGRVMRLQVAAALLGVVGMVGHSLDVLLRRLAQSWGQAMIVQEVVI